MKAYIASREDTCVISTMRRHAMITNSVTRESRDEIVRCVEENLPPRLPFVTGIRAGKVQLGFRRMLIPFRDWYNIKTRTDQGGVTVLMEGERSRITVEVPWDGKPGAKYKGPRGWVVKPALGKIVEAVAEIVEECVAGASRFDKSSSADSKGNIDYSEKLRSISWITRFIMKSILLRSEDVVVSRGGLVSILEDIVTEYGNKYKVIYVSGTGLATFRVLFIDGRLRGVYVNAAGEEHVGDDHALNLVESVVRLKVYGGLSMPER